MGFWLDQKPHAPPVTDSIDALIAQIGTSATKPPSTRYFARKRVDAVASETASAAVGMGISPGLGADLLAQINNSGEPTTVTTTTTTTSAAGAPIDVWGQIDALLKANIMT